MSHHGKSNELAELRDRLAGYALAALATPVSVPQEVARRAYGIADAMLAERERRP